MTIATGLLAVLAAIALGGVVAFLIPVGRVNPEHPFDPDPYDDREHVGRHRHPDDTDTTRLTDIWPHPRN